MIAVRILALLAGTLARLIVLPLAALGYINNLIIRELLLPFIGQMKKTRQDAEKECGFSAVEAILDA